jgi:hypothetical protein
MLLHRTSVRQSCRSPQQLSFAHIGTVGDEPRAFDVEEEPDIVDLYSHRPIIPPSRGVNKSVDVDSRNFF